MKKMHFLTIKMRSIKVLIVLTGLITCLSLYSCKNSVTQRKGEINIVDTRNSKVPEENLASHKSYDIEVSRILFMGNGYNVRYYQNEKDTLKSHSASYMTDEIFDKASYNWLTDTSVSIRLYNAASNKAKTFKVSGYGPTSSMSE